MSGDVHVIQGPWFTLNSHRHLPWVLYLDRCFYDDATRFVTLGWLQPDGTRDFRNASKRTPKGEPPMMWPRKEYKGRCVVFGDYGRDMSHEFKMAQAQHDEVMFRQHPAQTAPGVHRHTPRSFDGSLNDCWDYFDVAIGHGSTVLVDAERHGLRTHSTMPGHVVNDAAIDRENWLNRLTWCQWHIEEIASGAFWEHLKPCKLAT